ncbi:MULTISPECIES: hypothetical protein [unclassified Ruegeria]|nr:MULTISPECIES: hypothetical protein [unclassified Ruegeria]
MSHAAKVLSEPEFTDAATSANVCYARLWRYFAMLKGAVLYAKDLKKLRAFYLAIGGKQTDGIDGEFAAISNADTELIILQVPQTIAPQIVIEDPPVVRSGTPMKPIISTISIADVLEILPEIGGRPVPDMKQWKFRQNLVQDIVDPEGNVVQLWQPESS